MNEIQSLREKLSSLLPQVYPDGLVSTDKSVTGRAFFPAGRGLWDHEDNDLLNKSVMILGQDFDNQENFELVLRSDQEDVDKNRTWVNLLSLLKKSGIESNQCFFTNAIMGVRKGNAKNTGQSPGFKNEAFLKGCQEFFLEQIKAQRPKLILVLGWQPVVFLRDNKVSKDLHKKWATAKSITQMMADEGQAVVANVHFENVSDFSTNVVVLFHPSLRGVNVAKLSKKETANFFVDTEIKRIQSLLPLT